VQRCRRARPKESRKIFRSFAITVATPIRFGLSCVRVRLDYLFAEAGQCRFEIGQERRHWQRKAARAPRDALLDVVRRSAEQAGRDPAMVKLILGCPGALEDRGFDSLWVPEHSHIPLTRKSPFPSGGDLPKKYYDVMDPFVVLGAAAAVTKTLLLGTGICLIAQRDAIQTAKQVASIDQISGGRFLFGVGNGWNEDEMANHGTAFASRHKLARERIEAMQMAAEAGRDLASVPITIWGAKENLDLLKRDRDDGVSRVAVSFDSAKADTILPELDRWATLIRQLGS
jgi:hypothetical protein